MNSDNAFFDAPSGGGESRAAFARLTGRVFWFLILYEAVLFLLFALLGSALPDRYLTMLLCVGAGVCAVILPNGGLLPAEKLFARSERKMTPGTLLIFLGLIPGLQLLASLLCDLCALLGLDPNTASADIGPDAGFTAVLYACLLGPIAEEVLFRGFTLGLLKKGGAAAAIVISALCFGLMHMNPAQFIAGTLAGLLLGWVLCRYSLFWCCVLHIYNNLVLSYLPGLLSAALPDPAAAALPEMIFFIAAGVAAAVLGAPRFKRALREMKAEEASRLAESGQLKHGIFRCLPFYIYVLLLVFLTYINARSA